MLVLSAVNGYSLGPGRPSSSATRLVTMQHNGHRTPPPDHETQPSNPWSGGQPKRQSVSKEVDDFLQEADEFLYNLQSGVIDRKIAETVANSERKVLDRVIAAGRNALAQLKRIRRKNPAGRHLSEAEWAAEPMAPGTSQLASRLPEWQALREHAREIEGQHLRDLLADEQRAADMQIEDDGILLDYSRQRMTTETVQLLLELAKATNLQAKIRAMASGQEINYTEGRPVLHMALRARRGQKLEVGGVDVVEQVNDVRDAVDAFAERVRSGEHRGATGKRLKNIIVVGIGGSSLGPAFLYEALKATPLYSRLGGRQVRFLANIDELDTARAIAQLDAAETLVVRRAALATLPPRPPL